MRTKKQTPARGFEAEAERIFALPIAHRVNRGGGYGPNLEVIYERHPAGCASVLVDNRADAMAAFMSNGSVAFHIKLPEGLDVAVLDGSFDLSEKRESRVPSQNVWLDLTTGAAGQARHVASLINPRMNIACEPVAVRVVKLGDPDRAMWFAARFAPARGVRCETAVKFSFVATPAGPAVLRQVFVRNTGSKPLAGNLWAYFNLHGTQRFVYNKDLWYDMGLPVSGAETIVSAAVPYSDIVQIKRVSSRPEGMKFVDATCDYSTFVGDTAASALMPDAVRAGRMLPGGAGAKLNRFSTSTIAANCYRLRLAPGRSATLHQSLLYVTDAAAAGEFRESATSKSPLYRDLAKAFRAGARRLIARTPGIKECLAAAAPRGMGILPMLNTSGIPANPDTGETPVPLPDAGTTPVPRSGQAAARAPHFEVALPAQPTVSAYANSVWTGVRELYENCRAHGAKLANGIELGTRDRGQDMWPKMKEDPGRVRADLVHAMSMMYVTCEQPPANFGALTLREKLHGMFPRQYPSRWDDRKAEIFNDNRPYNDSALWMLNSINMYVRETGDTSILAEQVGSVRLTNPDRPETSGLVGGAATFTVAEVMLEVLECHRRHAQDTPYGMAQILYGDWCDPVDMFGTGRVGDASTRGQGKGVGVRLSAHLFLTLIETIDTFAAPRVAQAIAAIAAGPRIAALKKFAADLRQNIVRFAWEDGPDPFHAGFIGNIHELNADGSRPDYATGQIGYTLGSMRGKDFDGVNRRELNAQSYGLAMLTADREYLSPVPGREAMVARLLATVNAIFFQPKLGLMLYTTPIANNKLARDLVGRMGVLPSGCAENGEYHHAQTFMHLFRLGVPGQADIVWRHFKPMMSVSRDESLAGPFETPCTSYAADPADPHFGKGMYFGLSGSVDWIVQVYHKIAGLELALHDDRRAAVAVNPTLPAELNDTLTFKRIVHCARPGGGYREIPLTVSIRREGTGKKLVRERTALNGKPVAKAEVRDLSNVDRLDFEIVRVY